MTTKRRRPNPTRRTLIVNADDFGQSAGINRGVVEAHEHGVVTSASLMVRWPAAASAATYAREHTTCLSLGLHLDLGEWSFASDEWVRLYEVVPTDDASAIDRAIAEQLEVFQRLVGRKPTHLDSHQHVHRDEPVRSILRRYSRELEIPLRENSPHIRYCGDFYGQSGDGTPYPEGISVRNLLRIVSGLKRGVTELGCHPGSGDDTLDSMYGSERAQEVQALCDPCVRECLRSAEVRLCSFETSDNWHTDAT